jgi:hypothetical protein
MEDKVRMVGVRRWFVHARVDPTWVNPNPPSPLSIPPRPYLPGFPASGTARVPAPLWKRCAIRRVTKCPRCRLSALASTDLLFNLVTGNVPFSKIDVSYSILTRIHLSSVEPTAYTHLKLSHPCRCGQPPV